MQTRHFCLETEISRNCFLLRFELTLCEETFFLWVKMIFLQQNMYSFQTEWSEEMVIYFALHENKKQPFQLLVDFKELVEEKVKMSAVQKLLRVDQKVYLFRCEDSTKITVEVPSYSFEQELEVSKLVVPFIFVIDKLSGLVETQVIFEVYNFDYKDNYFWFHTTTRSHLIYFDYFIKNKNLVFTITKVTNSVNNVLIATPIQSLELYIGTEMKRILNFLSGAIIHSQNTKVIVTECGSNAEEQKAILVPEKGFKYFCKRHKNGIFFVLISFTLLILYFFTKRLFYPNLKKKLKQKRKFSRRL